MKRKTKEVTVRLTLTQVRAILKVFLETTSPPRDKQTQAVIDTLQNALLKETGQWIN